MDETVAPEDALLPKIPIEHLDAWLPVGKSILVERLSGKAERHERRVEAWSRDFVRSRLVADGAYDCSDINHPLGCAIFSRTRDGSRLYIQSKKPEAANG